MPHEHATHTHYKFSAADTGMWIRIKRGIVAVIGLAMIAWSIFAAIRLFQDARFTGSWDSWALLVGVGILFCLGCFTTYIAIRGSAKDVDDYSILP